jgi:predicted O-methyltransferase YrrM
VWTAEIIKELAEYAKENVERAGYADRVTVVHADASGRLGRSELRRDHSDERRAGGPGAAWSNS